MTTYPKRTRLRRTRDLQRQRSIAGVATRERNRMAIPHEWRDVGGFATDGVFGAHTVRLMACDQWSDDRLAVVVDGTHRQARTMRGVLRVLAGMVMAKTQRKD